MPADGTITSWAVRGARGTLALQILRGSGNRLLEVGQSADVTISGTGVHVVRSDLAVVAGDRVGLAVFPGAAIGIRGGTPRTAIERWFGPLLNPPRRPERPAGTGLDRELLLRVDIGPSDPRAPLASRDIDVAGGEVRRVAVVSAGGRVFVELFDGARRLARTPVRGADGRGRLRALIGSTGFISVHWRNPDGAFVDRGFAVGARGFS